MSGRQFQTGDRVRPLPGTSEIPEGDGTVTGTAPTSWRAGDHMVHVVHDNGTITSWDSSDLELLEVAPFKAGDLVWVTGWDGVGQVTSMDDEHVWVSLQDKYVRTGWRPANGYLPADVELVTDPVVYNRVVHLGLPPVAVEPDHDEFLQAVVDGVDDTERERVVVSVFAPPADAKPFRSGIVPPVCTGCAVCYEEAVPSANSQAGLASLVGAR